MKKLLLLGAAVFALQAIPAFAQDTKTMDKEGGKRPHHEGMFEKQDTDKDGAVSEQEFLTHSKAKFTEMDANKDGKITKEEGKAHRDAMKKKWGEKRKEHDAAKKSDAPAAE